MYRVIKTPPYATGMVLLVETDSYIPFDPANTDYQRFKTEINADEAELQDSEGVTMSAEEAKAFVATLP